MSYFWFFVSSALVLIALHWPVTLRDPNKTWRLILMIVFDDVVMPFISRQPALWLPGK